MSNTQEANLYTIVTNYLQTTFVVSYDLLSYYWNLGKEFTLKVIGRYKNSQSNTLLSHRRNAIIPANVEDIRRNFDMNHSRIHHD
jgi:hypothetical protein